MDMYKINGQVVMLGDTRKAEEQFVLIMYALLVYIRFILNFFIIQSRSA